MESSLDISGYSYLWNSERSSHALVKIKDTGDEARDFMIFDKVRKTVALIEDDCKKRAVCKEMLRHGSSVLDDFGPL